MNEQSKVQKYRYNQAIQKSIYLNQNGQEITQPIHVQIISKNQIKPKDQDKKEDKFKLDGKNKNNLTISSIKTTDSNFWDIFQCCKTPQKVESDYDDCYVCNRRVYYQEQPSKQQAQQAPYMSIYRMKSRQQQPIKIFYDKLQNHNLRKQRWELQ